MRYGDNRFRFTADFLKRKIPGLPARFTWWEGQGVALCFLDYEEEEKLAGGEVKKEWTKFSLKITGYNELYIKHAMIICELKCYHL